MTVNNNNKKKAKYTLSINNKIPSHTHTHAHRIVPNTPIYVFLLPQVSTLIVHSPTCSSSSWHTHLANQITLRVGKVVVVVMVVELIVVVVVVWLSCCGCYVVVVVTGIDFSVRFSDSLHPPKILL